jgi:CTP-dependent riboflavin kinase
MPFPGTYNFSYYKGDTYEFKIYPKNSDGTAFDLTSFADTESEDNARFFVSTERGISGLENQIECSAQIVSELEETYILCTITPGQGASMNAGTSYVYDVEIRKILEETPYVLTLVTGNIAVTDQVTGAGEAS